jgi:methyl-accepting chemotaxis protein
MNNLKIGIRLGLAFGCMVLLISMVAAVAYLKTTTINDQVEKLTKSNTPKIIATYEVQRSILNILRSVALMVGVEDEAFRAKERVYIEDQRKDYRENLAVLENLEKTDQGKMLLGRLKRTIQTMVEVDNSAIGFVTNKKQADADNLLKKDLPPLIASLSATTQELVNLQKQRAAQRSEEATKAFLSAKIVMSIIFLAAIVVATGLAFFITRSIVAPLRKMTDILQDIAQGQGDLTKRLECDSKDELSEVSYWFNAFIDKLHAIVSQIAKSSVQVAAASSQLKTAAEQIATGAEEVVAQTTTVATASEEMAATSSEISQNCQYAADESREANRTALAGAQVVKETISVMQSIAEKVKSSAGTVEGLGASVEQIGAIVGTIEDIADQTNLLALNAAIEAARAGEQGRGFAVVADEVRALADRTTKATREISGMIKAIQKATQDAVEAMEGGVQEVASGTEKAARSGEALEQILEQINAVASQIHQVATAAEEQTATTSEMSGNMQEITCVVQSSSRGATETAAASSDLSRESQELRRLVGQFKLD